MKDYPPPRIIVCAVQGDWIEWDKPLPPDEGDCPFGECDCTPVLYAQAWIDLGGIARAAPDEEER